MVKLRTLIIPRLFIVVLAPRVILAFWGGYLEYLVRFHVMFDPVSRGEFYAYAGVISWVGYVLDLALPFLLIYFLCTPDDLKKTYLGIIVTVFVGSLVGGIVGVTLGYLSAHSFVPLSPPEAIDFLLLSLPFELTGFALSAFSDMFLGFTAASISYIRRRWRSIERPLPLESTSIDAGDASDRGTGDGEERGLLIRRLLIITLLAEAVWYFLCGHLEYVTMFFFSLENIVPRNVALSVVGIFLPWLPIYFLYTPKELKKTYINIIVTLFVGAVIGNLVGFSTGFLSSTQFFPPLPQVRLIEVYSRLIGHVPESIFSFYSIFPGFTAVTVAYIRRRWSVIDQSIEADTRPSGLEAIR